MALGPQLSAFYMIQKNRYEKPLVRQTLAPGPLET